MLSPNELSNLYKIISDENQTFGSIAQSFDELFKDIDKLRITLSLCILIKDNLLNVTQRLIAYYIIYLMKQNFHIEIGPFLPLIIETIQISKYKTEQNFLFDLVNNQINYVNSTIKNFLKDNTRNSYNKQNILLFLHTMYQKYNNEKPMDIKTNNFIRHVLYDRKKNDNKNIDNHTNNNLNDYIDTKEEMSLKNFEPNYMSFYPSLNNKKFLNQEPVWIMPNLKHNFIWENLGGKC